MIVFDRNSFFITAKEYIRFSKFFQNIVEKKEYDGAPSENRYIALQTLPIIMRNYGT